MKEGGKRERGKNTSNVDAFDALQMVLTRNTNATRYVY